MPGKIKVRILAGRNLPVMDRSGDTTDAYVEIKFGNTTYKTDVCRKTLNPQWNSEWYRFEVDDAELQDEPLQLRLMDHDTYSANDAIGKVYLNLNPLLLPGLPPPVKNIWTLEAALSSSTGSQGGSVMTGWIPVFDTMHGIRGEVSIIVKVELFSDFNKFRQSSCGVQFFYSPNVPQGYHVQVIHGFVEELVVSDDPEYKWIDKIRTPRASNEARQTLFIKLSGEVQRKIGLKALDLGGNAVIGYCQNFDLEGESGIVARGIGTAVTLMKLQDISSVLNDSQNVEDLSYLISQSKNLLECSESDDGLPLLPNLPSSFPRSQMSFQSTKIGSHFPKSEWSKTAGPAMRISEYTPNTLRRHMSLQSSPLGRLTKLGALSTQSLSDELISESSLKAMLALEDMRGERTSAFSRGLKNLRYLPKRMIQMKSKISDSVDEESDDSTYSSTWSVAGSDSTRSSFSELRRSLKKKKFTHKKNQPDGVAAMLIRSVHAGFTLDSVLEDHETPTPSPVNYLEDFEDQSDGLRPLCTLNDGNWNEEAGEESSIKENIKSNIFTGDKKSYDYTEGHVPMISSSETDTSTSDESEPSESSTNYNILDDSFTLASEISMLKMNPTESGSFEEKESLNGRVVNSSTDYNILDNLSSLGNESIIGQLNEITSEEIVEIDRVNSEETKVFKCLEEKEAEELDDFNKALERAKQNSFPEGLILDCDFRPHESILPLISPSLSTLTTGSQASYPAPLEDGSPPLLRTSPSFKLKLLGKQNNIDSIDDTTSYLAASTPVEVQNEILPPETRDTIEGSSPTSSTHEKSLESELTTANITKNISLLNKIWDVPLIDLNNVEFSSKVQNHPEVIGVVRKAKPSYSSPKNSDSSTEKISSVPYEKYLLNSRSSETKNPHEKKEKGAKKVSRTETVIYKGPPKIKPKPHVPENQPSTSKKNPDTEARLSRPAIVIGPAQSDNSHLKPPAPLALDVNIHTPYMVQISNPSEFPLPFPQEHTIEAQLVSERFRKKYRQHCMLDLIRIIDLKMMGHRMHIDRKDSTRSRKRHGHKHVNSTPSPELIHRARLHRKNSRSKSPEKSHHHHHSHHNHQISPLAIHSLNSSKSPKSPQSPVDFPSRHVSNVIELHSLIPREKLIPCEKTHDHHELRSYLSNELPQQINDESNETIALCVIKKSTNAGCLNPRDIDTSRQKSHSEETLEYIQCPLSITNITNLSKMTDDTRVASPPLTPRLQEESSSPVNPPVFPASVGSKGINTPAAKLPAPLHRRSSDSDLSITPKGFCKFFHKLSTLQLTTGHTPPLDVLKPILQTERNGNSLAGSDRSMGGHFKPSTAIVRTMNQDTLEMLEYPFITMQYYPPGFILHLGGLVSARSVKLIERITNLEEPEGRDAWWKEIRMEVRSHARALGCNVVLGYKEEISICDDVCVLNASGTAAVINLLNTSQDQELVLNKTEKPSMPNPIDNDKEKNLQKNVLTKNEKNFNDHETLHVPSQSACSLCHLPYNESSVPFRVDVSKCVICRRHSVPDVLFTTIELPDNIPTTGRGCFLQATVCKNKKDLRGELNAKEISDCLPFLEYELHSLLLNKLKVKGMNAIFGLKVQVSIGERLVIGMAVGTAVFLTALPIPSIPKIASGNSWHNEEQLAEIQKNLIETVKKNREYYRLKPPTDIENSRAVTTSDTDESDEDLPDLDLGAGTKDACILEVDDVEDMDRINLLMDDRPPDDFHVVNTQSIPGLEDLEIVRNLQMFTQISRAKIPAGQFASMPSKYFARILQTIFFKLRRMVPCALCDMQFKVALPEQDEIQLTVVGMALGLGEPTKTSRYKKKGVNNSSSRDQLKKSDDNDLIFSLDEDHAENPSSSDGQGATNPSLTSISNSPLMHPNPKCVRPKSPLKSRAHQHKYKHMPLKERYGVDITPLSYLPGGRIERYLGNLNFFFIRESTSIRENGGLSGFTHSFVTEVLAIVRAHITALGGNAMVAFFMMQCVLQHSSHKNQGQCLINVGGDVVSVSYFGDERHHQNG